MTSSELDALYRSCDALLNICGATVLRDPQMQAPFRAYVETDPVTAELKLAAGDEYYRVAFADHHDVIVTYGENYGAADCGVPLNGFESKYRKTRQPVDLALWPMHYEPNSHFFTTIGNYRQDGSDVEYQGQTYRWSKHHEWDKFIALPQLTNQRFEVALKIDDMRDRHKLLEHGWRLTSPVQMSLGIFTSYPDYFQASRGEFTVAKDQNIRLRSGWFSERDACYLATGKPVIAQDTGFASVLPTGRGLFSFRTMDDILFAIDAINSNYKEHCKAARELASAYFDAGSVAKRFLDDIGL